MSENRKRLVCPACFAREIDVIELHYDSRDQEYYCTKCAYAGTQEDVNEFLGVYKEQKYKRMRTGGNHENSEISGSVPQK